MSLSGDRGVFFFSAPPGGKALENRFEGIDGRRGGVCLGIFIYHVNETFGAAFSEVLSPVYAYGGYFGNYLLFMLSGLFTHRHSWRPGRTASDHTSGSGCGGCIPFTPFPTWL